MSTQPPGYTGPVPPGAWGPGGMPADAPSPPPPAGAYVLAEYWRRAVAALIDLAIVGAGAVAVMALFGAVFSVGFFGGKTTGIVSVIVGLLVGVVAFTIIGLAYAPLVMARTNGQTLGKKAVGIRVIRPDGRPMDLGWAALREVGLKVCAVGLLAVVTVGLPWALAADCLWPLWDDESRALHDIACNTRVVRA